MRCGSCWERRRSRGSITHRREWRRSRRKDEDRRDEYDMNQDVNGDPILVSRQRIPLLGDGFRGISLLARMDKGKFLSLSGLPVRV
jgi:hypothetical protein